MDNANSPKEQDLYFDDEITLGRLSHPVSGKEFLRKVMYPRFWFWVPRGISHLLAVLRNEPKELLAKQTRRVFIVVFIVISLIVWAVVSHWGLIDEFATAMYKRDPTALVGGGVLVLVGIALAAFRSLRAIVPLIPESKNITLDEYDGHNIDLLIQRSSPKWLNRELYDDAWPVYNGRRNGGGNDARFQDKIKLSQDIGQIKLSQDNVQQLEGWAEDFFKEFVNGNVYFGNGPKQLTRVQRSLVVLWVINPPDKTALSGVNHQRFSDYARRILAAEVFNILIHLEPKVMKNKKISTNTLNQFLEKYQGESGSFNIELSQGLINELFTKTTAKQTPIQKMIKRLIN